MENSFDSGHPIVDAVLFNGEVDLLKLRIKYLERHVDKFVIGQSLITFSNKPKKIINPDLINSELNLFRHKIDYVTLDSEKDTSFWNIERSQRKSLLNYLRGSYLNHSVLYCDVDEIPSLEQVLELQKISGGIFSIPMKMTYLFANAVVDTGKKPWNLPKAISNQALHDSKLDLGRVRELQVQNLESGNLGCHLSYFMHSENEIEKKFKSFSHGEYDFSDTSNHKLVEIAGKFAVSPLGNFRQNSHGLLHLENNEHLNQIQSFTVSCFPESFKNSPAGNQIIRLFHSFQISEYQKSKGKFTLQDGIEFKRFTAFISCLISIRVFRMTNKLKAVLRLLFQLVRI